MRRQCRGGNATSSFSNKFLLATHLPTQNDFKGRPIADSHRMARIIIAQKYKTFYTPLTPDDPYHINYHHFFQKFDTTLAAASVAFATINTTLSAQTRLSSLTETADLNS
jgi:hypothetical protein